MTLDADALVVGAGPAGALAALTLARRGVRVLVLDRARFPRDKPCGGGMRFGALARFPEVAARLRERVLLHPVQRVLMEAPSGARVVAALEAPLYVTFRRLEFDAALLDAAREAGAAVREGARVTDVARRADRVEVTCADGRVLTARGLVGADGVNGVVARAAGLTTGFTDAQLAIDTMEETPLAELAMADAGTMYVAYGYKGFPGYGYAFPKAQHVDAGVGFLVSFYRRALGGAPYEHHRRFLEEAAARGVVRGRSNPAHFRAYRLPLGGPLARTQADRVLVCGDAGGFVNAYTGEGIYYAMLTGRQAGEVLAEALAAGDLGAARLAAYERRWRAEIGEELQDSLRIQRRLFTNPALIEAVIRTAAVDPALCRLFARVALGEANLRHHRGELLRRFALALLRARINPLPLLRRRTSRAGWAARTTSAGGPR